MVLYLIELRKPLITLGAFKWNNYWLRNFCSKQFVLWCGPLSLAIMRDNAVLIRVVFLQTFFILVLKFNLTSINFSKYLSANWDVMLCPIVQAIYFIFCLLVIKMPSVFYPISWRFVNVSQFFVLVNVVINVIWCNPFSILLYRQRNQLPAHTFLLGDVKLHSRRRSTEPVELHLCVIE